MRSGSELFRKLTLFSFRLNSVCLEMSENPNVGAPSAGIDLATQSTINAAQSTQSVYGVGATGCGTPPGGCAGDDAVLEAQLRAMAHGTQPLSAQQENLLGYTCVHAAGDERAEPAVDPAGRLRSSPRS